MKFSRDSLPDSTGPFATLHFVRASHVREGARFPNGEYLDSRPEGRISDRGSVCWHPEHLRVQLAFVALVGASAHSIATCPTRAPVRAPRGLKEGSIRHRFRHAALAAMADGALFRAAIARRRSHHYGCGRAARPTDRLEWLAVDEPPSRGIRCSPMGIDPDFRINLSDRLLESMMAHSSNSA